MLMLCSLPYSPCDIIILLYIYLKGALTVERLFCWQLKNKRNLSHKKVDVRSRSINKLTPVERKRGFLVCPILIAKEGHLLRFLAFGFGVKCDYINDYS